MDDGASVFVAELAPGAGFELEETRGEGIKGEPASGEDAEAVGVANEECVATGFADAGNDAIDSRGDISGGFAVRARLCENSPAGDAFSDFRGGEAFVVAVVPLGEVGGDFGFFGEAGELAGAAGAEAWAAQDEAEFAPGEKWLEAGGALLAGGGEGDVGGGGVAAREAPLGFAVADENDFLGGIGGHGGFRPGGFRRVRRPASV